MKIAIVNDVPLACERLRRILAQDTTHQVVWQAKNGREAVQKCHQLRPELILMDILMPDMDGVEATRLIMAHTPCPIILVTMDVERNMAEVFAAMGHGALDVVTLPELDGSALLRKINNIALLLTPVDKPLPQKKQSVSANFPMLIAIGASAGGPPTLAQLLKALPAHFPAAIVLVQHVDEVFAEGMANWLADESNLSVRLVSPGERPVAGQVLLAGTSEHLQVSRKGLLEYCAAPREHLYKPSIDVFFKSVALNWQGPALGVLLTGMGRDGAQGLLDMRNQGFWTLAQDRASSAVYGMPKAAAELNAACEVIALDRLPKRLIELVGSN